MIWNNMSDIRWQLKNCYKEKLSIYFKPKKLIYLNIILANQSKKTKKKLISTSRLKFKDKFFNNFNWYDLFFKK